MIQSVEVMDIILLSGRPAHIGSGVGLRVDPGVNPGVDERLPAHERRAEQAHHGEDPIPTRSEGPSPMPDQLDPTRRSAPTSGTVVAESVADWRGHEVVDLDGDKLGKLEDVFYDVESDDAVFITVKMGGLLGKRLTLVAISGASVTPDVLRVNYRKSEVKDAPSYDPDMQLTVDQEAGAYQHYGLDYAEAPGSARRLARR
jgi:hypothetical protein